MIELIQEAIALYNLPLTLMLGLVVFYWLMVVFGALDFETDLPDFGDGGGELSDLSGDHGGASGGAMLTAGRFLGFSQVPLAIWGSFFVLFLWLFALVLNHRFNGVSGDRDLATAAWFLIPSGIASLVLTKLVTLPVAKLFSAMGDVTTESLAVIGREGTVTTTALDHQHGQIEVGESGAPALINARLREPGPTLVKGDRVRILEASDEGTFYYVEPIPSHTLP